MRGWLAGLAAAALLGAGFAMATNRDDSHTADGEFSEYPMPVDTIRLASAAAGHVSVTCVVLTGPDGTYAAATAGNVTRNLVRSRLPEFLPVIGHLFEKPPRVRDFSPASKVGEVLLSGRALIVRLPGAPEGDGGAPPGELCGSRGGAYHLPIARPGGPRSRAFYAAIANGQHYFLMEAPSFRPTDRAPTAAGAVEVGEAHAGEGELLILVRPSILE